MKLGFLVNPIAGMGGRVGLKGTDEVVQEALELGAEPVAPGRAKEFLEALEDIVKSNRLEVTLVTCPAPMGEKECQNTDLSFTVVGVELEGNTTAKDTRLCVKALYDEGVRLLAFLGGDGTARDILDAVDEHSLDDLLVLGVPSGVKMYSGIFVVSPRDAAEVIRLVSQGTARPSEFEIMDANEEAFREDRFNIQLYGYLKGPLVPARFQGSKQASPETVEEHEAQEAIARHIVENMDENHTLILGPGTTLKTVAELLNVKKTTLGVDIYKDGKMHNDVNEDKILNLVDDFSNVWIVVSPIGHQGMLFGRGNQQISPKVIRMVGRDNIKVLSTYAKLRGIEGGTLKVDTGDPEVDEMLRGYIRVITDYNEIRLTKVE